MTTKTVLLIYPRTLWDIKKVATRLPLALLYIGSVLKSAGFAVRIIDQRVDDDWRMTLQKALRGGALWVGISAMTGRQIEWGLAAAAEVRRADPNLPIVWGGVHPSILPEQTAQHPLVDYVVIGEGEETALELSQAFARGSADFSSIAGLAWRHDGQILQNPPRKHLLMDDLPALDYSLVDTGNYILSEIPGERSMQITTSRGCPRRCSYCYLSVVPQGRRYRAESPERTVAHIERVLREFRLNALHIIDDEFFTQIGRSREICQMLLARGVRVGLRANCRVDYVDRMGQADLDLFRRAGFRHLYLGVESGNDRILAAIQKEITREQVLRVNRKLKAAGIAPKFSFMGGFPSETLAEVKDTIDLMTRLVDENPEACTTPLQLYSPYPGTPLFDLCRQNGHMVPRSLDQWADSGWERIDYHWLTLSEERFLQKAAYFTFFLDGKTVAEVMGRSWMRLAAQIYSRIVKHRVAKNFYQFMPEVALIRWALSNIK